MYFIAFPDGKDIHMANDPTRQKPGPSSTDRKQIRFYHERHEEKEENKK
jgi:hypothetical protein